MSSQNFYMLTRYAIALPLTLCLSLTGCMVTSSNSHSTSQVGARQNFTSQPNSPLTDGGKIMMSQATYAWVPFDDISNQATAILVGKVTGISPAQWNQDSGQYWCDDKDADNMACLAFAYLEMDVIEPIADTMGLEPHVKILVLSESYVVDEKGNILNERTRRHDLSVGDVAVFFVRSKKLAWRGGMRSVRYYPIGNPQASYFKLGTDGLYYGKLLEGAYTLDELKEKVLSERVTPTQ